MPRNPLVAKASSTPRASTRLANSGTPERLSNLSIPATPLPPQLTPAPVQTLTTPAHPPFQSGGIPPHLRPTPLPSFDPASPRYLRDAIRQRGAPDDEAFLAATSDAPSIASDDLDNLISDADRPRVRHLPSAAQMDSHESDYHRFALGSDFPTSDDLSDLAYEHQAPRRSQVEKAQAIIDFIGSNAYGGSVNMTLAAFLETIAREAEFASVRQILGKTPALVQLAGSVMDGDPGGQLESAFLARGWKVYEKEMRDATDGSCRLPKNSARRLLAESLRVPASKLTTAGVENLRYSNIKATTEELFPKLLRGLASLKGEDGTREKARKDRRKQYEREMARKEASRVERVERAKAKGEEVAKKDLKEIRAGKAKVHKAETIDDSHIAAVSLIANSRSNQTNAFPALVSLAGMASRVPSGFTSILAAFNICTSSQSTNDRQTSLRASIMVRVRALGADLDAFLQLVYDNFNWTQKVESETLANRSKQHDQVSAMLVKLLEPFDVYSIGDATTPAPVVVATPLAVAAPVMVSAEDVSSTSSLPRVLATTERILSFSRPPPPSSPPPSRTPTPSSPENSPASHSSISLPPSSPPEESTLMATSPIISPSLPPSPSPAPSLQLSDSTTPRPSENLPAANNPTVTVPSPTPTRVQHEQSPPARPELSPPLGSFELPRGPSGERRIPPLPWRSDRAKADVPTPNLDPSMSSEWASTKRYDAAKGASANASHSAILPTAAEISQLHHNVAVLFARRICHHYPDLNVHEASLPSIQSAIVIPPTKTTSYDLPTLDIAQSTVGNCLVIVQQYVEKEIQRPAAHFEKRQFGLAGDNLTKNRGVTGTTNRGTDRSVRRIDGQDWLWQLGFFHGEMEVIGMIGSNHFGPEKKYDEVSLRKLLDVVGGRKNVTHIQGSTPDFYAWDDYLNQLGTGILLEASREILDARLGGLAETLDHEDVPLHLSSAADIFELAQEVTKSFLGTSPSGLEAKGLLEGDTTVFALHELFNEIAHYWNFRDSLRYGHVDRYVAAGKFLAPMFYASGQSQYASSFSRWLLDVCVDLPPEQALALAMSAVVNTTGRIDGFIPVDLAQEHQNLSIKQVFMAKGSNASPEWLARMSPTIGAFSNLLKGFKTDLQIRKGGHHHDVDSKADSISIARHLRSADAFRPNKDRPKSAHPRKELYSAGLASMTSTKRFQDYVKKKIRSERRRNPPVKTKEDLEREALQRAMQGDDEEDAEESDVEEEIVVYKSRTPLLDVSDDDDEE
ncbi:hypothetical protein P7C70_g7189, partial [Phenoliferia sp. Uapishka_3]